VARFAIRVGTASGSIQTLQAEGENRRDARRSLEAKGYFVFEAEEPSSERRPLRFALPRRDRINPRLLLVFNQELLALVKAGLPILTALTLLRERGQNVRFRALLAEAGEAVRGGASLSASLARHPRIFSPLYTASLQAGEQAGNLVDALSRYVAYQKRVLALRQRLKSALMYPAILTVLSAAVVAFLLVIVVPTFTSIYGDMEAQLPAATRVLISVTGRLRDILPLALGATAAIVVAVWRWRRTGDGRRITDRWLLAVPWVGSIVEGYLFSRFARTLAMTLTGGIPMIPALHTTLATVGNGHLADAMRVAVPRVTSGSRLADALAAAGVFPSLMLELVSVGESSGALPEMLGHVADLYDGEMDTKLAMLAAAIEPVIMVGMGLVVATIVVIMYLPIFNLSSVMR
jgi:type IV pilus assembly protein PilC